MIRQQNQKSLKSKNSETPESEQAYRYALRLLTGRDYSASKIRAKLAARDISEQDAEATILRLKEEGWLDDRRYAERFADSALSTGRFYGFRLRQEMRRRGFETVLIDDILRPLLTDSNEVAEVKAVAVRRYPDFKFSDANDRDKRRVIGFLQRRGFGISAIMRALRTEEYSY